MKEYRFQPEINLDPNLLIPLRLQLREQIKKSLMRNRVKPGTRVVSERFLSEKLKINRNTVHQAYQELLEEDIFECKKAQGGVRVGKGAENFYRISFPALNLLLPLSFSEQLKKNNGNTMKYIAGILDHAAEKGISVNIMTLPSPETPPEKIREYLEGLLERSIGVITMGKRYYEKDPVFEALLENETIAHVFVTGKSPLPHISSVCADMIPGAREALKELKKRKVKKIGLLKPLVRDKKYFIYSSTFRMDELQEVAEKEKMSVSMYEFPGEEKKGLSALVRQILKEKDPPKVFFANNDSMAVEFIRELSRHSFRVPEDFQVIGYDDSAPEEYHLSSIDHDREAVGRMAVDLILELYEKGRNRNGCHKTIPSRFISRASSNITVMKGAKK